MLEEQDTPRRAEPRASRPALKGYGVPPSDEGLLPWSHAEERLAQARNYWVATTRPDGRPHVVPLWAAWVDGALYWEGGRTTRWARNIAANPEVAVHLESGDDVVILEGAATEISAPEPSLAARIVASYAARYPYRPDPEMWKNGGLYRFRPRGALAWTRFPQDMTRWQWEEA